MDNKKESSFTRFLLYCFYAKILFDIKYPSHAPTMQSTKLARAYPPAVMYLPDSNSLNVSNENVEKVVKPPHIPTLKNSSQLLESLLFETIPAIKPIAKEPIRFMINVITGKSVLTVIRLNAYLKTAPIAPPIATIKKTIIHLQK